MHAHQDPSSRPRLARIHILPGAKNPLLLALLFLGSVTLTGAQDLDFTASRAEVDFARKLRPWDGFGFNYVETAHTYDYDIFPQEYGGFSLLDETEKREILELVFGDEGLRVGLLKMFLGANHQATPHAPFDHTTTTRNMCFFAREGLEIARAAGRDLKIITTLYGPPGWITRQKTPRGRDLDPAYRMDLVDYVVDWVRFLREEEGLPVRFVSLHNEGEDWMRWNADGLTEQRSHDYNLYWPPEQVVDFVKLVYDRLQAANMSEVGVTPGETTNWYRFGAWGYAGALADDAEAHFKLGLITSHGFYSGNYGRWFGEHQSAGIDVLRARRPNLHAWVTSTSWSQMDARNIKEHHGNIYTAKVNGIIPWAGIQRPPHWVGGDPNPGSAFTVREDGTFEVRRGYFMYKQVTRAGQPGMAVVQTTAMDSEVALIGFASNNTSNPDAFVLINIGGPRRVHVRIRGSAADSFTAWRTTGDDNDLYRPLGEFSTTNRAITYEAPAGSVTTFFALGIPASRL